MFKTLAKYILTFITIISIVSCSVSAYQINEFTLNANTAILLSLDTGEVLYSQNADQKVYPASLTKILSAIIVVENTPNLDSEIITTTKSALRAISG
ncbi:MAG: D-alanyl-D-alanine carboxypeptidase, partial [Clostridia bacterium]|nr:D-alanyl-D-alanine carboxypeptidase [Clostridia bacterium]